jgi:TPR repeat protein
MDEHENLPAVFATQVVAVQSEKRGSLVGRGIVAVLANKQQALTKNNDAIYRQAREVYNQLTDDGLGSWLGYKERELPLTEVFNSFQRLAAEGYGKAYYPLSTLYGGEQSINGDPAQAELFRKRAFDWLFANQLQNDPEIWNDLGKLYLTSGADNCIEGSIALHWFLEAAKMDSASAMWHISGMYESGYLGFLPDGTDALYWQIKAAKAGHEAAQHGLEQQHEHGDLVTKIDDEQVFDWYVWSAEQGHLWAQLFLASAFRCGDLVEQDDEQAAHWYLQAATQGEPHAQLQLGKMYWEGRGVEQNYDQAEYWLENSADQGSAESQYQLGQFLCEKGGDVEVAAQLIQCAADQEYGPAQYIIASDKGAIFDVTDEQCEKLFDKAFSWYEERAVSGDSELRLDYALMHLDCWNSGGYTSYRVSHSEGLHLLKEVATEWIVAGAPLSINDVQRRACRRLGIEVLKFSPCAEDIAAAIHVLEQAANLGDTGACVDLAELYLHGNRRFSKFDSREPPAKLVEIDPQAAVYWFERGFQLGWSGAANKLGYEYLVGKHLPQNLALAEKWLLQAANAGHGSSKLMLGQEYASGVRLRQDADAAIHWLELATEDLKSTGLKLAEIYLDGKITPRNFDEAIKWLTLAAENGFRNKAMKLAAEKYAGGQFSATEVLATQMWLVEMAAQAYETVSDEKYPAREAINAFDLGELYELGLGVEYDMENAVTWYTHAAELDNRKAQTRLDELGIDWENT